MRKLARSFFWIDQELVRSGLWLKLPLESRLAYVALAASVNKDGISLWGEEKLLQLAGIKAEEWIQSLTLLIEFKLIKMPESGECGIHLLNCSQKGTEALEKNNQSTLNGVLKTKNGPFILKTITTVELGDSNVNTKDAE